MYNIEVECHKMAAPVPRCRWENRIIQRSDRSKIQAREGGCLDQILVRDTEIRPHLELWRRGGDKKIQK
jgi:hypothetical protein